MRFFDSLKVYLISVLVGSFFLLSQSASAQFVGAQYKGADGIMHDYIIYDGKGQPIPIGDHSDIVGSPFLQEDWAFGTVLLADGSHITDSLVNYSLYNNRLYFRRENRIYEINYAIKGFTIENREEKNYKKLFQFRNGYSANGKNDSTTFYEVLVPGNDVQLLKWEQKKVREVYHYGGAYESNYTSVFEYFIYLPDNKKIQSIGTKPDLKKLEKQLPEYKVKIENYIAVNKTDFRKEESIVALFASLNTSFVN